MENKNYSVMKTIVSCPTTHTDTHLIVKRETCRCKGERGRCGGDIFKKSYIYFYP